MEAIDPGPVFVSRCPWGTDRRGAPVVDPGREASNDKGGKHSRGRPRCSLVRLAREKSGQESEKGKESQTKDDNNFNKTSNGDEQANCRKQMRKAASGT